MRSYGPVILHPGEVFFVTKDHQAALGNRKIHRRRVVFQDFFEGVGKDDILARVADGGVLGL